VLLLSLVLAACATPTETAQLPTATTIPTFAYVAPTAPPSVATAAAATQTAQASSSAGSLDMEAVERGRARYEALACAECHGENGEGVDDVPPLSASVQTEDEFIAFMRSGGDIGPDHQFASNRLSASGGRNLYQYLLSIRDGE
jgi:mono/diheme cytochrome c family protein